MEGMLNAVSQLTPKAPNMSPPMYSMPSKAAGTGSTAYMSTVLDGHSKTLRRTTAFTAALAPNAGGERAMLASFTQAIAPTSTQTRVG